MNQNILNIDNILDNGNESSPLIFGSLQQRETNSSVVLHSKENFKFIRQPPQKIILGESIQSITMEIQEKSEPSSPRITLASKKEKVPVKKNRGGVCNQTTSMLVMFSSLHLFSS